MAPAVFAMMCLNFVLDEINSLGFLHHDVEGWEAYALRGAGEALCGVNDNCLVVYELWYERYMKRRYLSQRGANVSRSPCNDVLNAMAEHTNFEQNR